MSPEKTEGYTDILANHAVTGGVYLPPWSPRTAEFHAGKHCLPRHFCFGQVNSWRCLPHISPLIRGRGPSPSAELLGARG